MDFEDIPAAEDEGVVYEQQEESVFEQQEPVYEQYEEPAYTAQEQAYDVIEEPYSMPEPEHQEEDALTWVDVYTLHPGTEVRATKLYVMFLHGNISS